MKGTRCEFWLKDPLKFSMQHNVAILCPGLPPAKICPLHHLAPLGCLSTMNGPTHSFGGQKE